jgi:hypothetical protein
MCRSMRRTFVVTSKTRRLTVSGRDEVGHERPAELVWRLHRQDAMGVAYGREDFLGIVQGRE